MSAIAVALATIAIFAVTLAQWRVLSGQLAEMRAASEQSARLIEANKRLAAAAVQQANASQRAAAAAESSAQTARESQLLSRRAWVGPYSVKLDNDPKEGNPTTLIVKLKNTGREPAKDVVFQVETFMSNREESNAIAVTIRFATTFCLTSQPKEQSQVIYPQSDSLSGGYDLKRKIEHDLLASIAGGNFLFVTGCVAYNTVGRTHRSAFCYFYNPLENHRELSICSLGNRAD